MENNMQTQTIKEFLLEGEKEESFLISDISKHGCSGGTISELIYYDDTVKFHDNHQEEIWDELNNQADDYGYSVLEFIDLLNGGKAVSSMTTLKNLLSWWICEIVAHKIEYEREGDHQNKKNGTTENFSIKI